MELGLLQVTVVGAAEPKPEACQEVVFVKTGPFDDTLYCSIWKPFAFPQRKSNGVLVSSSQHLLSVYLPTQHLTH